MIKAFECVRQGCLHVQSEACLTQEKVPLLEGRVGVLSILLKREIS